MKLRHNVAVSAGGASGTGEATAVRFVQEGAFVPMLKDVHGEALQVVERETGAAYPGVRVKTFKGDVASAGLWGSAVATAQHSYVWEMRV